MRSVSSAELFATSDLRTDAHFYALSARIAQYVAAGRGWVGLEQLGVTSMTNGLNLSPQSYVGDDEEAAAWYASVGSFSSFAFQSADSTGLRGGPGGLTDEEIQRHAVTAEDVLLTRSGTPGIAWALSTDEEAQTDLPILPSGFTIRLRCDPERLKPAYLAAILNHPLWRVWTSALAAGKRQRNLSQDHLRELRVPALSLKAQRAIAARLIEIVPAVRTIARRSDSVAPVADRVLVQVCGLPAPPPMPTILPLEASGLDTVATSRILRIDFRFLRSDTRSVIAAFDALPSVRLGDLVARQLRRAQPRILAVDQFQDPRVIATGSLRAGQVVELLTKQTDAEHYTSAADRQLKAGDLLVAMDGEGSIGKSAVAAGEYEAICDSHVAAFRLADPSIAMAVSCFLNSTVGQAFIYRYSSGATGQIQLAPEDLLSIRIPKCVIDRAVNAGDAYARALTLFQGASAQIKAAVCGASALVSQDLAEAGAFVWPDDQAGNEMMDGPNLQRLLAVLTPRMF
jgi:hypothetical protein